MSKKHRNDNDIPLAIFEFQWYSDSPSGKYKLARLIKERGFFRAVKKFREEFTDWGEPIPEGFFLQDIRMIQGIHDPTGEHWRT